MVLSQGEYAPHGVLAMPGDVSGGHNVGVGRVVGVLWVETRDTRKHPVMRGVAPHNKEVSTPEHQSCRIDKAWYKGFW